MIIRTTTAAGLLGLALAACQSPAPGHPPAGSAPLSPTALQEVRHGTGTAAAHHALGRYYQGMQRHDEAIASFQRLLAEQPHHADARNRLGLSLAALGELEPAIAAFRRAREDAPGDIGIRNNLGYALLLHGQLDEAIAELQAALALAPDHVRLRDNLAVAMAGRAATAPLASSAPDTAVSAPSESLASAPTAAAAVPAMPAGDQAPNAGTRLEITNGNGVVGLARRTARAFAAAGYPPARVTNARPYRVAETVIEFQPGYEEEAGRLQRFLGSHPPAALSHQLRRDIPLRLVIGHDTRTVDRLFDDDTARQFTAPSAGLPRP